jgi:16S rRNA processing protein RimM
MTSKPSQKLIPLAEVARPHGIRGELRLKVYNRDSDLLRQVSAVTLQLPSGKRSQVALKSARWANEALLVTLESCKDRNAAEALRGAQLLVDRAAFPPPEEDEYYACDLEGASVFDVDGEVGVVKEVVEYPTCDALLVEGADGSIEIPMIDGVVVSVDLDARKIVVTSRQPLGDLSAGGRPDDDENADDDGAEESEAQA